MGVLEQIMQTQETILKQQAVILQQLKTGKVPEKDYINQEELMERWGCAYFTINKAMKRGLKHNKFGRKTMFALDDVKRYEREMNV